MLLLGEHGLDARRPICAGPLASLYDSLAAELAPVLVRRPEPPRVKALLSRAGGRCERDGTPLEFDPWSPDEHRCPACGTVHRGDLHHRAWVTHFQLWLSERCVHAAVFHALRGDQQHAAFARDTLRAYAERYATYPNRDNVLGPTRLFFSTYLESIWLLQMCLAAESLAHSGDREIAGVVCDRIIEPSRALIAGYDEGMSNRQVWNNAALLASAVMLGDDAAADRALHGDSGLEAHLSHALLGDGTWYEGENYHQFALRGLWYGVTLAEARGAGVREDLTRRFQSAFATPFLTALPDFTMPSRKDSQYAVSLRQWRMAELTELGYARNRDPRLAAALARCYEPGHERRDTGRARSTADVERNTPSSALTRADLGWRALLFAVPELPAARAAPPRSALLHEQGLAVFRRADEVYVALDYGQWGGGHGHPDRLDLLLSVGTTRVLDDLGTGSYVDPSLDWYRSSLAHNAPFVHGQSQMEGNGALRAYDEREGLGWIVAAFRDRGVHFERTLVVAPEYLVDELRWAAPRAIRVELPWHLDGEADLTLDDRPLARAHAIEDGFAFVTAARGARVPAGRQVAIHLTLVPGATARLFAEGEVEFFTARAPGQPPASLRPLHLLRADAASGCFRAVIPWSASLRAVTFGPAATTVELTGGERHVHRRDESGWHLELFAGGARSSIDLGGLRPEVPAPAVAPRARPVPAPVRVRPRLPSWAGDIDVGERASFLTRVLGEAHYRQSEDSWRQAGAPRAEVVLAATDRSIVLYLDVRAGDRRFASVSDENPYDNEEADTMAAGVQLYARTPDGAGAWMLVPEPELEAVRVRAIAGWGQLAWPTGAWRPAGNGYEMRIELPIARDVDEYPVDVDVVINETTADRERRRGQLVLSGAAGEFVYLRGDRHDAARLVPLLIIR